MKKILLALALSCTLSLQAAEGKAPLSESFCISMHGNPSPLMLALKNAYLDYVNYNIESLFLGFMTGNYAMVKKQLEAGNNPDQIFIDNDGNKIPLLLIPFSLYANCGAFTNFSTQFIEVQNQAKAECSSRATMKFALYQDNYAYVIQELLAHGVKDSSLQACQEISIAWGTKFATAYDSKRLAQIKEIMALALAEKRAPDNNNNIPESRTVAALSIAIPAELL